MDWKQRFNKGGEDQICTSNLKGGPWFSGSIRPLPYRKETQKPWVFTADSRMRDWVIEGFKNRTSNIGWKFRNKLFRNISALGNEPPYVSFGCDQIKSGNCLNVLEIVKKEPIKIVTLFVLLFGGLCAYLIVTSGSFFTISYAWVFHDLIWLYTKLTVSNS